MNENDFASIYRSFGRSLGTTRASKALAYQLVNVPLVYHVLVNQTVDNITRRLVNDKQIYWATNITNKLFNIYNKKTKKSIQFASFITEGPYLNTDSIDPIDCYDIPGAIINATIMRVPEWQYKFHVITCESAKYGSFGWLRGKNARLPEKNYSLDDFRRRSFGVTDTLMTCVDDAGNNLCTIPVGLDVARSTSVANRLGFLFGLYKTSNNGCDKWGDGVSDTPAETGINGEKGCPGLLPYNKDRDLYKRSKRRFVNKYKLPTECRWGNQTCPNNICTSCYDIDYGNPLCCASNIPFDSCKWKAGIDPGNNVMSYALDICNHEFTPGQLVKMMAQTRANQKYVYCNYANVVDTETCTNIPCASTATSPNCKK